MTPAGNFEGHNILNRLKPQPRSDEDEVRLAALRAKLLAVRDSRVRPGLDDKVLADWNGLMIAALANASLMLDEPSWLDMAERAFDFVARTMTRGDRLGHSWREGQLKFPGLASDFAAMIRAALALYEATGRQDYLDQALAWQHALDRDYANAADRHLLSDRRRRRGPGHPPGRDRRRGNAEPQCRRGAESHPARGADRRRPLARKGRPADRGDRAAAVENLYMHMALLNAVDLRLRAAEIVVTGEGDRRRRRCSPRRARCRLSTASCSQARSPERSAASASGAREARRRQALRRPSSASARPARCR